MRLFSTEVGAIAKFFIGSCHAFTDGVQRAYPHTFLLIAEPGMDWEYFKLNPMHDQRLVDAGEGRYELIVVVSRVAAPTQG